MRKLLFWLLALLAAHPAGWAQVIRPAGDTTSLTEDLRAAFSTLNPSRTKTGILLNQVVTAASWHDFSGTGTPKNNAYASWRQQYHEYYSARFNQGNQPTLAAVTATVQQHLAAGELPLVVLSFRYDELRANAVSSGLIRIDSTAGRLYDQYPPSQPSDSDAGSDLGPPTPYENHQFFAVALAGQIPLSGDVTVWVGKDLWFGTDRLPATLRIDFGDGTGVKTVGMGSRVLLHYGTPADRAARQAGQRGTANTATVSVTDNFLTANAALARSTPASVAPDEAIELYSANVWPGQPRSMAVGWVKWGDGNTSGRFRKPLVFVEGIDFGCKGSDLDFCRAIQTTQTGWMSKQSTNWAANVFTGSFRNGDVGWNEMVDYRADFPAVEKLPGLRAQLTAQGYDLIFLDFTDGAALIQSNAMTLVELLNWINDPSRRTSDAEETIVTAASMGGQVARFALAWMEQQQQCHNAKLYVSIDSPHRGANIPLGLQALIQRLRYTFVGFAIKPTWESLNRPAAQQMLVYHINEEAGQRRAQWQDWQRSPGSYPTHLRKIAIADGNRLGKVLQNGRGGDQFDGQELVKTTAATFFSSFLSDWGENYVNALRGADSRGNTRVIYRYRSPYTAATWHYVQAPSGVLNYDLAPGGTRPTTADIEQEFPLLFTSGSAYQTFIPTVSALDVSAAGTDLFYNVRDNIPDTRRPDPTKYAFEAYYAPDGISEPHINITNGQPTDHPNESPVIPNYTSNNSAWLLNELAESAHRLPATFDGSTHYPGVGGASVSPYNFGSLYRRLLPSVEIGSGGQLHLNNNSLPISGGVNTANDPKELSFEMYTSSCGSRVVVGSNGSLTLGQQNDSHTATVRIGNNSLVELRSGASARVNAGSTLRIERGGTLLVRAGSVLFVYGRVIIEDGGYVCVENPGNVAVLAGGQFTALSGFQRGANPALGLANPPSCDPGYPGCTPSLSLTSGPTRGQRTGTGTGDDGEDIDTGGCSRVYTVTAEGDNLGPTYSWTVSNTVDGVTTTTTVSANAGHPNQVNLVLKASSPTRTVRVTASNSCTSQTLQATTTVTGEFPTCDQVVGSRAAVTMYPNPAGGELDFAPADLARVGDYEVSLYDGQGGLRWQGRSAGGKLHLASGSLPRGIYGVVITQGEAVSRRTLSLE